MISRPGGRAKSKPKRNSKRGRAKKGEPQLFAFDDGAALPAPSGGGGRPKRKLKSVLRFDQVRFDDRETRSRSKVGHGFDCPRCSFACSYDARRCGACGLECYYEAGMGVVTLKERRTDRGVRGRRPARGGGGYDAAVPGGRAAARASGGGGPGGANDDASETDGPAADGAALEIDAGGADRANRVDPPGQGGRDPRNMRLCLLANPGNGGDQTVLRRYDGDSASRGGEGGAEGLPPEYRGLDRKLIERITHQIVELGDPVQFDDVVGLEDAKMAMNEMLTYPMQRPDLFRGLRAPKTKGLLLFGPPGTGKTLIAKAIAHETGATFFSISSSSLTSKWLGEGEQLVRTLFAVAAHRSPSVVFVDEFDFLLSSDATMQRLKSEFCVQVDGASGSRGGHVLLIGATNKPWAMDADVRRRFAKRLHVPLPDRDGREAILRRLLGTAGHVLTGGQVARLARETCGYSGADLRRLCEEAAMGPVRGHLEGPGGAGDCPPISYRHFQRSLEAVKPSVDKADLARFEHWNSRYGSKIVLSGDDDSDKE